MTLNIAFHSDCQYAGISMTPLISEAKVILIIREQLTEVMCLENVLLEGWHGKTYRERQILVAYHDGSDYVHVSIEFAHKRGVLLTVCPKNPKADLRVGPDTFPCRL